MWMTKTYNLSHNQFTPKNMAFSSQRRLVICFTDSYVSFMTRFLSTL